MLRIFPLFLLALPILEIYVFVVAGDAIGGGWVVSLVILSAIIGIALIRRQGIGALQQAQMSMSQGQQPVNDIFKAIIVFISGILFVVPGFITDGIGLILLTGIGRGLIMILFASIILPALMARGTFTSHSPFPSGPSPNDGGFSTGGTAEPEIIPANTRQSERSSRTSHKTGRRDRLSSGDVVEGEYTIEDD